MRRPIIHESNRDYRIVSRPNNEWVVQHRAIKSGTKTTDPWDDISGSMTQAQAVIVMYERMPRT
jgi:hypothetical protein